MTSYTVFHLDGERTLRGGERQLLYLAAALRARGHRSVVVCRKGSLLALEAGTLALQTVFLPFLMEWDPVSALLLRRLAGRSSRPVLHSHTAHTAALAAMACGRAPRVAHRRVDFEPKRSLSRRIKYDSSGAVVAISAAIKEILIGAGVPAGSIEVVPDGIPVGVKECRWVGIDQHRFSPSSPEQRARLRREYGSRCGVEPDTIWVGNLAALVPHKDHDTLLAAAFLVLRRRPKVRFLVAGDGPLRERLQGQVKRMDLQDRVHLLGRIEDGPSFLKSLDVLAHSSWGEGMGSVLIEAAACRVPIAATTAGGIPEVVEDGRTGLLVSPRDPEALAEAIVRLVDDRGLAAALATAGRGGIGRFSLTSMAERMESIYARVVKHA